MQYFDIVERQEVPDATNTYVKLITVKLHSFYFIELYFELVRDIKIIVEDRQTYAKTFLHDLCFVETVGGPRYPLSDYGKWVPSGGNRCEVGCASAEEGISKIIDKLQLMVYNAYYTDQTVEETYSFNSNFNVSKITFFQDMGEPHTDLPEDQSALLYIGIKNEATLKNTSSVIMKTKTPIELSGIVFNGLSFADLTNLITSDSKLIELNNILQNNVICI